MRTTMAKHIKKLQLSSEKIRNSCSRKLNFLKLQLIILVLINALFSVLRVFLVNQRTFGLALTYSCLTQAALAGSDPNTRWGAGLSQWWGATRSIWALGSFKMGVITSGLPALKSWEGQRRPSTHSSTLPSVTFWRSVMDDTADDGDDNMMLLLCPTR